MNKKQEQGRENSNITEVYGELSKKDYKLRGRGARFFTQSLKKISWEESAFTLIELLIVIGISAVLLTVTSLNLFQTKVVRDLEFSGRELATHVQEVRTRSVNQQDGKQWGLNFINEIDGRDKYEVFSGESYAAGEIQETRFLQRNARFVNPSEGNNQVVIFDSVDGRPDSTFTVSITNASNFQFDISIGSLGRITTSFYEQE